MAGSTIPDTNPLSFNLKTYLGFLIFGLTPAVIALFGLISSFFFRLAKQRTYFRSFYTPVYRVAPAYRSSSTHCSYIRCAIFS